MKKTFILLIYLSLINLNGQIGIGTATPDPNADLTLGSPNKGLMLNKVVLNSSSDFGTIGNHVGMVIYNTSTTGDVSPGLYINDGLKWQKMVDNTVLNATAATLSNSTGGWKTTGNGSTTATDFIGTTDNKPLVFKTNGTEVARLTETGQLGLGTTTPNPNAILDLSSTSKGLLLPRISAANRSLISSAPNGMLYFLQDENCLNYYATAENRWKSVCGTTNATATIDLTNTQILGYYDTNPSKILDETNYLLIPVTVTQSGQVTILGTTTNGYFFSITKTYPSAGTYNLKVPADGDPTLAQTDVVTISINGKVVGTKNNIVYPYITKNYSLNCSSIVHNSSSLNIYKLGTALTIDNWFEIKVDYDNGSRGSSYIIQTNTVDGINFYASGTLPTFGNTATIRLQGSGMPTSYDIKTMVISTNSESSTATCKTTIKVPIPILGLGGGVYQPSGSSNFYSSRAIPESKYNFGNETYSTIKNFGGFSFIDGGYNTGTTLSNLITNNGIKIIVIGYAYDPDVATAQILADFTRKGGFVWAGMEGTTGIKNLIDNILGVTTTTLAIKSYVTQSNTFPTIANDPLLDGAFGSLSGLKWGEDVANTYSLTGIPTTNITILGTSNVTGVTAFKHNTYPFVWFGDGGILAGDYLDTSTTIYPCHVDINGKPIAKPSYIYSGGGTNSVYNSLVYANFLAWAISVIK